MPGKPTETSGLWMGRSPWWRGAKGVAKLSEDSDRTAMDVVVGFQEEDIDPAWNECAVGITTIPIDGFAWVEGLVRHPPTVEVGDEESGFGVVAR